MTKQVQISVKGGRRWTPGASWELWEKQTRLPGPPQVTNRFSGSEERICIQSPRRLEMAQPGTLLPTILSESAMPGVLSS